MYIHIQIYTSMKGGRALDGLLAAQRLTRGGLGLGLRVRVRANRGLTRAPVWGETGEVNPDLHTHTNTSIYIYTYTYICICIYIYVPA